MPTWMLEERVSHLNHASFGATPREVIDVQDELRRSLEANPTRFMARELPGLIDEARSAVSSFVGADSDGLVFVTNATTGVNAVLRSCPLRSGDEILVTDHGYNACRNAALVAAAAAGATVVDAAIPIPIAGPHTVIDAISQAISSRTRLIMVDHVTSPTALVFPVQEIIRVAGDIPVLVDGAHAPGMLDLELDGLGAAFYAGNLHKWVCAPKGAGFLWAAPECRDLLLPGTISHGWNAEWPGRTRYQRMFDYVGTDDPTAWLSVPAAIDVMGRAMPGGWRAVMTANHELVVAGRDILTRSLGCSAPAPEDMLGSMASIALDPGPPAELRQWLFDEHAIEVPVLEWNEQRILRISAQLYNREEEYRALADALGAPERP
jgi:isopenicillin-N epimerase